MSPKGCLYVILVYKKYKLLMIKYNFFIFNQKKMLMLRVKIQMGGFKIYLGLKLAPTEGKERDTTAPQPWFSQMVQLGRRFSALNTVQKAVECNEQINHWRVFQKLTIQPIT